MLPRSPCKGTAMPPGRIAKRRSRRIGPFAKTVTIVFTWFLLRLENANQWLKSTRNRVPRLQALRKDIDRLPADDRAWTLLWLPGQRGSEDGHLIKDKELVAICQKLGQDKLLKMLAREKISDDPDLQPATGNQGYMISFVLAHVKELMTK